MMMMPCQSLHRGLPRGLRSTNTLARRGSVALRVVTRAGKKTYHTVQKGEWLSSIAPKYDVTTEQLIEANAKTVEENGELIFPGQQLVIPKPAVSPHAPGYSAVGVKGVLVKITVALLVLAAASGIWPTIKESQAEK